MAILFSAVILTENSNYNLISEFEDQIPKDWKTLGKLMYICKGELPKNFKYNIGEIIKLNVTHIAITEKVIAVQVNGYYSSRKPPYITLAIAPNANEADSDKILAEDWKSIKQFAVTGIVREIPSKQKLIHDTKNEEISISKSDLIKIIYECQCEIQKELDETGNPKTYIQKLSKKSGIDITKFNIKELLWGLKIEQEHNLGNDVDVVKSDMDIFKIIIAHLREDPRYYSKLKQMEQENG